jgi:Biotin carboxylase
MATDKKTIMIFGAGLNQLELIKAARELNMNSVVIDPTSDPPGKELSDFFYQVDGQDKAMTKEIARRHGVDGIVTAQMENPLRLMAQVAEELQFIFNSPKTIEQCRNKFLMKAAFVKADVPCAKGILLHKDEMPDKLSLITARLNFPLIIKPVDAFSSRGVYKVNSFDELLTYVAHSSHYSTNGDYLIEEFIAGTEYSVETITFKGKTHTVQFTEKYITPYPQTVEVGHLQPAIISNSQKNIIELVVSNAIKALGIDNSASHTELKLTNDGVKIIEIGARLGGDFIGSYLTKASTGVNMDKAAIQVALGQMPDLTPTKNAVSLIRYIELPVGRKVIDVLPIDEILAISCVRYAHIFVKAGDIIKPIEHSAMRPACFIVAGQTLDVVKSDAVTVEFKLKRLIKLD